MALVPEPTPSRSSFAMHFFIMMGIGKPQLATKPRHAPHCDSQCSVYSKNHCTDLNMFNHTARAQSWLEFVEDRCGAASKRLE